MKSTPIELISTFRKKISFQTVIVLLLISAMIITGFLFYGQAGRYSSALQTLCIFLLMPAYMMLSRHRTMMKLLDSSNPAQSIENIENHIQQRMKSFRATTTVRLIFGGLCVIGMILIFSFKPLSQLGGAFGVALALLAVLSMLVGWTNMQDSMMLQDLKHCQRNQPSEIS